MNRLSFFPTVTVNGIQEKDPLGGNISKFKTVRPVSYYRVAEEDLMRPDLISHKAYGDVSFWWVICVVNNIQNPLLDLSVGQQLQIPDVVDIYDFNKVYRVID